MFTTDEVTTEADFLLHVHLPENFWKRLTLPWIIASNQGLFKQVDCANTYMHMVNKDQYMIFTMAGYTFLCLPPKKM